MRCISYFTSGGLVTNTTNEAAAFYDYVDRGGNIKLNATQESMDVYLLVLGNGCFAQVQTQTTAEGIKPGTVERLTMKYILVAAVTNSTADALTVLIEWDGAL